jgi:hypothetical protein
MVEELILSFVHEPWISEIDFTTLEKVSGSYISDDLRDREDDIVWRVRVGVTVFLRFYRRVRRLNELSFWPRIHTYVHR